ncbi:SDR family NAD(P)-dependent oxidoreductase [Limoniibacter endophyticus]|uniref:Short-chain dehydrogenase n=1 Tax=Limoniibacter endophyticus TaxID=1565040 RepID=A0A8J3DKH8_9HYPH|nr:SDR family oxidoreductase [Limoniibacter endophyticus]GHC76475.1 short-chain dehydrogenase [Limoniibacter endophyticus]
MLPRPLKDTLFNLEGRRALVTGSSRGIGAAIAEGLSSFGAEVVLHGTTRDATDDVAAKIRSAGGTCHAVGCDLSQKDAGVRIVEEAERIAGAVDILVINASAQINGQIETIDEESFALHVAVNLRSTVDMLQFCLPKMRDRGWGRVVSIGSINQTRPKPVVTMYAATKAAQHNLVQSLAQQYARSGVLLNTLAPGLIDTDRNAQRRDSDPEGWGAYIRQVNWMGRAGHVNEMVGAAVFLSSNACSFMTGETITMSGGV